MRNWLVLGVGALTVLAIDYYNNLNRIIFNGIQSISPLGPDENGNMGFLVNLKVFNPSPYPYPVPSFNIKVYYNEQYLGYLYSSQLQMIESGESILTGFIYPQGNIFTSIFNSINLGTSGQSIRLEGVVFLGDHIFEVNQQLS